MKPLLIGLTGKAKVGKDTSGHYLNRHHGFELYALAWPLKSGIEAMFDLSPSVWTQDNKEAVIPWLGKSPRQLMQSLGTEWGRQLVHPDIWVRAMLHRWDMVRTMDPPRLCVMDVRFDNEAEAIRLRGGVVVKIIRPDAPAVEPHSSEAGVSDAHIDHFIRNDRGVHDLEKALHSLMGRLTV